MPKKSTRKKAAPVESEGTYMLKLALFIIIGSQWLRVTNGVSVLPVPLGFVIGLIFTTYDHFIIDRKIEYAVLLMAAFIGFWIPMGLNLIVG